MGVEEDSFGFSGDYGVFEIFFVESVISSYDGYVLWGSIVSCC